LNATLIENCRRCGRHEVDCADGPAGELALCETCHGLSLGELWPAIAHFDDVDRSLARVRDVRRRYPAR
jgi:hypothetical protein